MEERIDRPHTLAREAASDHDRDHAWEYVHPARRVAERSRYSLPRAFRRFSCDGRDTYLHPGVNVHARTCAGGHAVVGCNCGATGRYPY